MDNERAKVFETDAAGVTLSYRIVACTGRVAAVFYRYGDEVMEAILQETPIPPPGSLIVLSNGQIGRLINIPTGLVAVDKDTLAPDTLPLQYQAAPETVRLRTGVRHFTELPGLVDVELQTDTKGKWLEDVECVAWPVEHVRVAGTVDEQQLKVAQATFENSETMRVKKVQLLVLELEGVFSSSSTAGSEDVVTKYTFEKLEHSRQTILAMQEEQNCFEAKRLSKLWRQLRVFEMERRLAASAAL